MYYYVLLFIIIIVLLFIYFFTLSFYSNDIYFIASACHKRPFEQA